MITFCDKPIPVVVEGKDAYILYVESGGQFENDVITCVHLDGGIIRHYASDQVLVHSNATFGIKKQEQPIS
jgi:hypothetical protein